MVEGPSGRHRITVAARSVGGGWLEYTARFPEDFDGAGVVAGTHKVSWQTVGSAADEELAADEFRFP